MSYKPGRRYFDLSTLLALGVAAFLLLSLPGGCGESDEANDEGEDVTSEAVAEPTEPPMLEIVDPEPGEIDLSEPEADDSEGGGEPAAPEEDGEEPAEEEPADAPDGPYVVQQGDTLYDIAVRFNVSMDELMSANGMDDPNALQVGQELQIPE